MTRLRCFDILENSTGFDAQWYNDRFPDAAAMGLSARAHFEQIGFRLGRGISAALPELDHAPKLARALRRQPRISYCTPVMNRADDLRATLAANLDENRPLAAQIEFVVVFLDDDTQAHDWIRHSFADDLRSGYLRLIIEPPLQGWHFGRAKNRHRAYARGDVYSSLDGDNFVTHEETEQLLAVADAHPEGFVFHHFTGNWGDGSSGRVSLTLPLYLAQGYDESFLPRQYDEMDLMLSVLASDPALPLIRIAGDNHGFAGKRSLAFWNDNGVTNPVHELPRPHHRSPINPKGEDYVQADTLMEAMTTFNQALCFLRNATTPALRDRYLKLAVEGRHAVIDALPGDQAIATLFHPEPGLPPPGPVTTDADAVCLFACMKNDDAFLPAFYAHYKALGVTRFFIVDDGSDTPIRTTLPHDDVVVVRPRVGQFVTAKGLWIDAMIKAWLAPGGWALTLDADEFMDLPAGVADLPALVRDLAARGADTVPALLIDMVPDPAADAATLARAPQEFQAVFDHYTCVSDPLADTYAATRSIAWGFGPYAGLSWMLDTRYHAFGTFDALRKMPLFRARAGRHVNQGFHTLHYTDDTPAPGTEIWNSPLVLPIRHFKLLKLASASARAQMAAHVAEAGASPYHARTTANIARIFGPAGNADTDAAPDPLARILTLPSRPYSDNTLRSLDPRRFLAPDSDPTDG